MDVQQRRSNFLGVVKNVSYLASATSAAATERCVLGMEKPFHKRSIIANTQKNNSHMYDATDGSNVPGIDRKKSGVGDDELVSSGLSPDDEDDDVENGSGSPDDEIEGSGRGHHLLNVTHVTTSPLPPHPPTTTTAVKVEENFNVIRRPVDTASSNEVIEDNRPRRPVEETQSRKPNLGSSNIENFEKHHPVQKPIEDHNILIEDSSTVYATPLLKSTAVAPTVKSPPTGFDSNSHRTNIGAIFKPGILAAVIGGFVVGILAAILLVMFIVYRMRKKDEGSYALDEQKQPPIYPYAYQKAPTKEFYA